MSEPSAEKTHVLPMAWSLHQTARLMHFIDRCGRENCAACDYLRVEIERRDRALPPETRMSGGDE